MALALAALAGPALAEEKANQVTLSVGGFDDRLGFTTNYLRALSGDLRVEGMLLRIGGGIGGDTDGDASRSVDALVGYQFVEGNWKTRVFAGITYLDTDGEGEVGLKLLAQLQNKKTDPVYVSATAVYTSPDQRFGADLRVGGQIGGGLVLGPEIGGLFSSDFTRTRVGLFLTGFEVGDISLTLRGGYTAHDSDSGTRGAVYLGMSATRQF